MQETLVRFLGQKDPLEKGQTTNSERVAQLVKNPPSMQETLVRFLSQKDPLEKRQTTNSELGSSAGKEATFNAGDPFDSWVGKIPWRRDRLPTPVFLGFSGGSDGKESACNVGNLGSIPRLGRSSGGGHGNPLQYSCMENPHGQRSLAGYSL